MITVLDTNIGKLKKYFRLVENDTEKITVINTAAK